MKNIIPKLFRWQPSRETLIVLVAGAVVVGLSAAMLLFENWPWVRIAIRDVGQIFLVGILLPLAYIQRSGKDWAGFGFSSKKWPVFLLINLVLGVLLFFSFLSGSPPPADFRLSASTVWSAAYVMLALCFELVFFYAFLRTFFEQAFGIVPAIIMTAFLRFSSYRIPTRIWQIDFRRFALRYHISAREQCFVDFPLFPGSWRNL